MKKVLEVLYIDQTERWVYGCESVSTVMLLQHFGVDMDPDTFIDCYLPRAQSSEKDGVMHAADPTYFYINEPRDLTGWGCYAPCIANALDAIIKAKQLPYQVVNETGKTAKELCDQYIDQGIPVVFWATLDFMPVPAETTQWILPDGKTFTWKSNEHCLLLVGYDEENYYFNDPWHNHGCCPYPKALVEQRHRDQDLYAVTLIPTNSH